MKEVERWRPSAAGEVADTDAQTTVAQFGTGRAAMRNRGSGDGRRPRPRTISKVLAVEADLALDLKSPDMLSALNAVRFTSNLHTFAALTCAFNDKKVVQASPD
eukprot:SAG31_NODE_29683_length_391_cov_1.061644_1_plen_103_part_10